MLVVQEFQDVFFKDLPSLAPYRELEFKIEFLSSSALVLIQPYRMTPVELNELKTQLQDFMKKDFIRLNVFPCGASILFVKKRDGTMHLCIDN